MKNLFTAFIGKGEAFLVAACPEVTEAAGQGITREDALRDLAGSIQSVLEYRCQEALSRLAAGVEQTVVEVP
jgi:predicted RNase H-like HicB family nuclease